eukprot:SAG11_NODE_24634_length_370_cov_1.114391_1_plen_21_part_10
MGLDSFHSGGAAVETQTNFIY